MPKHRNRLLSSLHPALGMLGLVRILASVLVVAAGPGSSPAEDKSPEDKLPFGLRVQPQGNSWSFSVGRLRALEAAAGIKGGEYYPGSEVVEGKPGPVYMPGCLNGKKKPARECATLKALLEAGKVDVFSYTHSGWHETDIAEEVAEFGFAHNKNFRVLWQAGWMVHDGLGVAKNGPARDAVEIANLQAALDKAREPVEEKVEAINKKLGKRVVTIVPVGDAFVKMRAMVVEGKLPGVTKQSELFNDDMPHQGRLGSLLQDYCIFAALYHRSPVGLEIKLEKEITQEQNAILQKLAWEMVSKHLPLEDPKPDKEGWYSLFDGKTLKGWKAADHPKAFKVEDGLIVAGGTPLSHLYYVGPIQKARFKDFELKAEVKTRPKGNSGIIFHTEFQEKGFPNKGFEFQINNTGSDKEFRTGSIYPTTPMARVVVKDDEWFECCLAVRGNQVTLTVNGEKTIETTLTQEANKGRTLASGTFAIQGHDPGSVVHFRSIRVKPLD